MKRAVFALVVLLGLSPLHASSAPEPEAFSSEFVAALRVAFPNHSITTVEPLRLTLKGPAGVELGVFLGNAYDEYVQDPSKQSEIIARYIGSILESAQHYVRVRPERIVPVIKDRSWLDDMRKARACGESCSASDPVVDDYNGDLVIVYAEDTPTSTRYFAADELSGIGVERRDIRALAVGNLRRILPAVEMHRGPLVSMVVAGGDYVASLVLLDELWSENRFDVDGDIVIAVPSRDVLLLANADNKESINKLSELAKTAANDSSYWLTSQLFVYRGGQFVRYPK